MKIYAIAKVTFLQIIRQPIFGVLLILALGIMTLAPSVTAFTLDDDNKMLQDLCLSTILVFGLLLATFSASGAISAEIDDQTILTIVSKPINRLTFISGKFLGVMASLLMANIFMLIVFQLVLRHGVLWAAYIERDIPVIVFGLGAAGIALIFAGLANYMFDWQFSPTAMAIGLPLLAFAAILTGFSINTGNSNPSARAIPSISSMPASCSSSPFGSSPESVSSAPRGSMSSGHSSSRGNFVPRHDRRLALAR